MGTEAITYIVLGALAGGFINGFAGTATALFSLGLFLAALPPQSAVALVATLAVLSGLQGMWVVRDHVRPNQARILRLLVPGILGLPLGAYLLHIVDAAQLRLMTGALLLLYGSFFGFRAALPAFDQPRPKTDVAIGFVGGVLGGLASLSGALPTIWLSMRGWPKIDTRAVLQSFNMVLLSSTALMLTIAGAFDRQTLVAFAIALPISLIAARIGIAAFKSLNDAQFRRTLILLCLLMGALIVAQALLR